MSYFKEAVGAIEKFSERFRENPWNYLYEADVQFELMQCLKEQITGLDLTYDSHKISAVKSEYPGAVPGGDNRFDLVAIEPSQRIEIRDIYNRPVSIAMELKLNIDPQRGIDSYIYNVCSCTLEKDLNKLSSLLKPNIITTAGFAILCIKPYKAEMYEDALNFLQNKDKDRFNLIPIDDIPMESEQPSNGAPMGVYTVIIGEKNRHYFKLK